jgi:hypothetical protein
MPPTALVTETAAVRTPSAIVKLVPKRACVDYLKIAITLQKKGITQINMGQRSDRGGGSTSSRFLLPAIRES